MPVVMRAMPRLLLLLFCMSVVTMMFIARCGLSMDGQFHSSHQGGLPVSSGGSPGEKALREVMRRKEVEHVRDKSMLQEKIKSLEAQLLEVRGQVVNLTVSLNTAKETLGRFQVESTKNQNIYPGEGGVLHTDNDAVRKSNDLLANSHFLNSQKIVAHSRTKAENAEARLVYLNDGLNPLPRYRPQNDRSPGFAPEDRKPLYYVENNTFLHFGERHRKNNDNEKGNEELAQYENGLQRNANGDVRSVESRERMVYNIELGNNGLDTNLADAEKLREAREEIAIREGVFQTIAAGSNRLERSAVEPGFVLENKHNPYPSLNSSESVNSNADNVTGDAHALSDFDKYFQDRLKLTEILKGQQYKTEYELIPFNRFIFNRVFMVDPGLGKRVVEKPIGSKKKDLNEILYHAVDTLNKNRSEKDQYTYNDFIEGMYRSDPASGSHYELFFLNKDDTTSKHPRSYVKMSIFRPFAPPMSIQQNIVNTALEWINIILPLSKRVDTFRIFMHQFVTVCIKRDKRIYLTVVYFGTDGLKEVKSIMGQVAKTHKFKYMKLVTLNETFTRGRGLQIGALNWKGGGDVLLFFCDVDIVFTSDFLERCRLNSEKGHRVYYPIVFSLYNPKIVYSLQDVPMPSFQDQLVLSKDTGFWRDFGYGMTCLYRSDFLKIKGFDEQITGWGGEDVFLYQKFVRSEYFVVRATDPAIFHLWHEKFCDPTLSAEQYRSCIRSKALNEASHAQLGLLAFKDEIDVHRGISEKNSLINKNGNG